MAEGLSLEEMRSLVGRISYKPGWRIEFVEERFAMDQDFKHGAVRIQVYGPNSRAGNLESRVAQVYPLTWFDAQSAEHVVEAVRRSIRWLELHEMDEWLAVDGHIIRDPHLGDPDYTVEDAEVRDPQSVIVRIERARRMDYTQADLSRVDL